jgi:membrane protease YdiL (CAAX protease family)
MPTPPPDAGTPSRFWLLRFWDSFIVAPLRQANEEARQHLNSPAAQGLDGKVVTILIVVASMLIFQHYLLSNDRQFFYTMGLLRDLGLGSLAKWWTESLGDDPRRWLIYWAVGNFVLYVIIPGAIVKLAFRQKLADYGFKLKGAFADWWVYPLFLAIMLPLVFIVSRNQHFQHTYPFYDVGTDPLWPWFWVWEAFYALQFLGLEFFFRGFMVHGLRHRFGAYSIPVMMVPYCMIHFQKPMPETFGAIIAGFVLGFMSLRTRSVILGAALHIGVAVSMDLTSLWRQGYFGSAVPPG